MKDNIILFILGLMLLLQVGALCVEIEEYSGNKINQKDAIISELKETIEEMSHMIPKDEYKKLFHTKAEVINKIVNDE